MKVIDAHTGRVVRVGDTVPLPGSGLPGAGPVWNEHGILPPNGAWYRVIDITPGLFRASMLAMFYEKGRLRIEEVPLKVRWTHPGFPLQHVAFVPS